MVQLTPISRDRLIRRHLDEGMQFKTLTARAGISLPCACKWLAQYRSIAASRSGVDR